MFKKYLTVIATGIAGLSISTGYANAQINNSPNTSLASGVESASVLNASQKATLVQANDYLANGQGQAAFDILSPLEPQLSGVLDFDILFGQAALAVDQPSIAAFAFERCLALHPRNGYCRLGITRAHISLQEHRAARAEIATIQQSNPPTEIRDAVDKYLDVLSGMDVANQDTRLASYVQLGIGYDSNINNATSSSSMAIPAFGGLEFELSRDGRSRDSGLAKAKYHISYSSPLSSDWRLMAEANIEAIGYDGHHSYNTLVSDASLGALRSVDNHKFLAKVQYQNYRLHDKNYRDTFGLLGQYTYSVTDKSDLTFFGQLNRLSYSNSKYFPNNSLRDANRYTLGASWMQGLANDRAVVFLTGYGGSERTIKRKAPRSYDYSFAGARVGGMYLITPRLQLEGGVGAERRNYRGKDLYFLNSRRDTFYDAYAGLNYAVNRKFSIRPQYQYYKNNSNGKLYGYKRHVFTLNLRYELF